MPHFRRQKFIHYWQKTTEGDTTIAYNNLTAFKFPDAIKIYLTCNIEICSGGCDGSCAASQVSDVIVTTSQPCYPGSPNPRCRPTSTTVQFQTTQRPTTVFNCFPGSNDPKCPPNCYPGSSDRRCPQSTTQKPTTQFSCTPGKIKNKILVKK